MRFNFNSHTLDTERVELRNDGQIIAISPRLYRLLLMLVTNPNVALSKAAIRHAIWQSTSVEDTSITQAISELRTLLGDQRKQVIQTLSGFGYKFAAEIRLEHPRPAPSIPRSALVILPFEAVAMPPLCATLRLGIRNSVMRELAGVPALEVRPNYYAKDWAEKAGRTSTRERLYVVEGLLQEQRGYIEVIAHVSRGNRIQWSRKMRVKKSEPATLQRRIARSMGNWLKKILVQNC